MSAINLNTNGTSSTQTASGTPDAYSDLTSGDFLKIMFSELTQQDPLQPNSTKDLLEQIGQVRSIESNITLTDRLNDVVKQNEVTSAGTFVGQIVQGLNASGAKTLGLVNSVSISNDGVTLNLGSGDKIDLKNLQDVFGYPVSGDAPADTAAKSN